MAVVPGHLLALERPARVLTLAGRTVRTVRHGHAVGGAQAAEVPALHGAREALTDRGTGHVDQLTLDEVVRLHGGADFDEVRRIDTKLSYLTLGLDLGDGELAALRLGDILRLDSAR